MAEADRAEKLGSTSLGEKVALLNIYADVVKASNDGVSKVVFVDPSTTQAANPLGLVTLQSLQNDSTEMGASKSAPKPEMIASALHLERIPLPLPVHFLQCLDQFKATKEEKKRKQVTEDETTEVYA